jgi:2-dehydropantoate 2-reductase
MQLKRRQASLKPLVERGSAVVSLLNGVDAIERLAPTLGHASLLGGLAFVSGVISEPGVIRYTSGMSGIRFGEADGSISRRAARLAEACHTAGFGAEVMPDIRAAQWSKLVGLATNAALTSLFRLPAGHIYHAADTIALARRGFEEVAAVARAQNIAIPASAAEDALKLHQSFPKTMYASMAHDLMKGNPLELESLSGTIVRLGKKLGVPTPVHEMAYLALRPYLHGAPAVLG